MMRKLLLLEKHCLRKERSKIFERKIFDPGCNDETAANPPQWLSFEETVHVKLLSSCIVGHKRGILEPIRSRNAFQSYHGPVTETTK